MTKFPPISECGSCRAACCELWARHHLNQALSSCAVTPCLSEYSTFCHLLAVCCSVGEVAGGGVRIHAALPAIIRLQHVSNSMGSVQVV
jgi:hypothetical protein